MECGVLDGGDFGEAGARNLGMWREEGRRRLTSSSPISIDGESEVQ